MMAKKRITNTIENTENIDRFLVPDFSDINNPANEELAGMLEEIKLSSKKINPMYRVESVYIAENVKAALANATVNLNDVEYYPSIGLARISIWDVARFSISVEDGWSQNFISKLSKCAANVVIDIIARSVHMSIVYDGVFYDNETVEGEPRKEDIKCRKIKLTDFHSKKFKVQGVLKTVADYEPGREFLVFKKEKAGDDNEWKKYMSHHFPSAFGGYVDDEDKVLAFSRRSSYPVVYW